MHAAAGPLNHWFYLLSNGSNGSPGVARPATGSTVTGVGIQTAGKIFYNGLLLEDVELDATPKARVATLTAAPQPVRHDGLHDVQPGEGRLDRRLRAGAVG